jgi:tetratricopeptide (TPR) repeat protein
MIEQAFISGQLGKAIYEDGGRFFVIDANPAEPVECRPMDFSEFFSFGAEVTSPAKRKIDLTSLQAQLRIQTNAHHALQLVVSGMDAVLDLETRTNAIKEAESLITDDQTHAFVRSRLLSSPLPHEADIANALQLASQSSAALTTTLYQTVIDAEESIELVQEIWNETALEYFSSFEAQAHASKELIDLGAFAEFTSIVMTGNLKNLNSLVVTYAKKAELKDILRPQSMLLNDFRSRLVNRLSTTGQKEYRSLVESEREDPKEDHASFKNRRGHPKPRMFKANEAKERVDRQILAISKQISQGNLNLADRYLTDLIGFQLKHSEREHLAMSLCSLAKTAINARVFELAERMVNCALELGIDDVVIPATEAELLRASGDFNKALKIYEETIARFPNNEVTRSGYAEVLKATGEFDKALEVYKETMTRFPNDEVARNGYAEVLKATGKFGKALEVYEETMTRFPNDEVARNGYAGVLKATGEFDKALEVYKETMSRFPNNEVARNGYAEVLKATGEFDNALEVYEETLTRFPNSEVASGGYAEVLKRKGLLHQAAEFYREAMSLYRYNRVLRNGYASVLILMNKFQEARLLLSVSNPRSTDDWIDYHIIAMSYLKEGDLDEAVERFSFGLGHASYAERAHFAAALAVAKIRRKEFEAVIELLPTQIPDLDIFQKETRLALVGHSQAALGKMEQASQLISKLENTRNPRVISLRDAMSRRYGLGKYFEESLSNSEANTLDINILDQEYFLVAEAA